jgi:hypothetical protein
MPLKLNIGMSRKVGEPNYGSRGATVGLEMEVDSSLVDQPRQLHERIARLFRLAKQSVDRELGSSDATEVDSDVRPATPAQVCALHAIANRLQLDLSAEIQTRFGAMRPDELSLQQASQLIDTIKSSSNGTAVQDRTRIIRLYNCCQLHARFCQPPVLSPSADSAGGVWLSVIRVYRCIYLAIESSRVYARNIRHQPLIIHLKYRN